MTEQEIHDIHKKVAEFPFKTTMSLEPILKFWEKTAQSEDENEARYATQLLDEVKQVPVLTKPIKNMKTLKKHEKLVKKLMSAVFPPALAGNEIKAAIPPFNFEPFIETKRYAAVRELHAGKLDVPYGIPPDMFEILRFVHSCAMIMGRAYQVAATVETPFVYKVYDPATRLDQYYKMTMNPDFMELVYTKPLKKLTQKEINHQLQNVKDVDLWLKNLPPENFELRGFVIPSLVNVTVHEAISALKNDLLEKDAILSNRKFEPIQHNVRTLLKMPDVSIGLGVYSGCKEYISNFGHKAWSSVNCKQCVAQETGAISGSIYQEVVKTGKAVFVEDLHSIHSPTRMELKLIESGVRSLVIAPLTYEDDVIGFLEMASPNANELNMFIGSKLKDLLPLFSIAMKRSMDERDTLIDAIIKQKCTAIHPSVEWKFEEAAQNLLSQSNHGVKDAEMEPIVFKDVYPLFGMSDIRGSSTQRNLAIQSDLVEQLSSVRNVLIKAQDVIDFPVIDEFLFRIRAMIKKIKRRIKSEDESLVFGFLNHEVGPLFKYLSKENQTLSKLIRAYSETLDPELGVLYKRRKAYENTVMLINNSLSDFLDKEEDKAQKMYPHYFEKYKTDGIDYNIYVGKSLLRSGNFEPVCLNNLRLWQLRMMCEMTKITEALKPKMEVPLETAQLILVHDDPLAIRFRMDEKQFDVDGAYNMRYEIVKKRIDKAYIKGTEERLTQPGKIAIVYSHEPIAEEYMKYINYLQEKGLITENVDDVKLEDMQGVQGLKALRVEVAVNKSVGEIKEPEIEEIIKSLRPN